MTRPEDVAAAFEAAWNQHDMAGFAALFHETASFVNRFARHVRGVDEIIAMHRPLHEGIYRDSALRNELMEVIVLGEGAAAVYFWSRLCAGAAHPAGAHEVDTLVLAVVTQKAEGWRIQALENVTLTNPRTGEIMLRT